MITANSMLKKGLKVCFQFLLIWVFLMLVYSSRHPSPFINQAFSLLNKHLLLDKREDKRRGQATRKIHKWHRMCQSGFPKPEYGFLLPFSQCKVFNTKQQKLKARSIHICTAALMQQSQIYETTFNVSVPVVLHFTLHIQLFAPVFSNEFAS